MSRSGAAAARCSGSGAAALRQRVDDVRLLKLLRLLSTRLSALFLHEYVKKRKSGGQSRVYVTLGIIIAPMRRREALWPRIDRRGPRYNL